MNAQSAIMAATFHNPVQAKCMQNAVHFKASTGWIHCEILHTLVQQSTHKIAVITCKLRHTYKPHYGYAQKAVYISK